MDHLYLVAAFVCITLVIADHCTEEDYQHYLGTKTPYRIVRNQNTNELTYPGCEAKKLWMLVRHGTRNPSTKYIVKMSERLPEIRDLILENNPHSNERLRNTELDAFRLWKLKANVKHHKRLTHEGEEEMLELGERMQLRFPALFPSVYSNTSYFFKYTSSQRTNYSARYFAAGLFGRQTVKDVWFPEPSKADPVLRFYKLCSKWTRDIGKNAIAQKENLRFETTDHVLNTVQQVNTKLGLNDTLSLDDVRLMYLTCAFETAWNKRTKSPWCIPFTVDTLKVMEFAEDLKYYWKDGYGFDLTYKQACPAFRNMIEFFNGTNPHEKTIAYFTHSGTILKMLAHLGLYKDAEPLVSTDFKKDRLWRVSKIDSFGSNIAFVLFKCGQAKKLLVLHQENVVRLPTCLDGDLCDMEKVLQYYDDSINNCSFNEMCEITNIPPAA